MVAGLGSEVMDPLHATIEEFATERLYARRVLLPAMPRDHGLRPMSWLPKISMGSSSRSSLGQPKKKARPAGAGLAYAPNDSPVIESRDVDAEERGEPWQH